ncbi:replication initiator protein [Microviridae sp.]|nr:replication initiator protein [Microviridae sp.]
MMPCYNPITAYRSNYVNPVTEKRQITFNRKNGFEDMQLSLPCGKCEGCLKKRVDMWALRCMHEAAQHEENCFITLTYSDEFLPPNNSLLHRDFQLFMKRLRRHFQGKKIRYFMCGEYGSLNFRPHYHALLFGVDFSDKIQVSTTGDVINYSSSLLSSLWSLGHVDLGMVHYGTAKYCAKYSLKALEDEGIDYNLLGIKPEYQKMSTGIGAAHATKFSNEIGVHDNLIVNGFKNPVPRYYENFISPSVLQDMKDDRVKKMRGHTLQELNVKRIIKGNEYKLWKK